MNILKTILKKSSKSKAKPKKDKWSNRVKKPVWPTLLVWIFWIIETLLTGCGEAQIGGNASVSANAIEGTGFMLATPGNYDSADYAVLMKVNSTDMTMQFQNIQTGLRYTLNYDGATSYADAHDQAMSAAQLEIGSLSYITFMKNQKRLNSLAIMKDSFHYDEVNDYVLVGNNLWIGDAYYTVSDTAAVIGESGPTELSFIDGVDNLSFYGSGKKIESIRINRGHGFLELENDDFFDGGFLEVSTRQILKLSSGMVVAVPTGTYAVTVSGKGCSGTETLTFEEGKTTVWDVSGFETTSKSYQVFFKLVPSDARIYIDGEKIDLTADVILDSGIHHMIAIADGYSTISDYITVSVEKQEIEVVMEKLTVADTVSGNSVSENGISESTVSENTVSGNTVSSSNIPWEQISQNAVSQNNVEKSEAEKEAERLRDAAEKAANQ